MEFFNVLVEVLITESKMECDINYNKLKDVLSQTF